MARRGPRPISGYDISGGRPAGSLQPYLQGGSPAGPIGNREYFRQAEQLVFDDSKLVASGTQEKL
jgi:hypothetical protein